MRWSSLILPIVYAVCLFGCDDGADLDDTPHRTLVEPTVPTQQALDNPVLQRCSRGAGPYGGYVRIKTNHGAEVFYDHCLLVPPDTNIPYLTLWDGAQWKYPSGRTVMGNIGAFEFYVPANKCMRVEACSGERYTGTCAHFGIACAAATHQSQLMGLYWLYSDYGMYARSLRTRICDTRAACESW